MIVVNLLNFTDEKLAGVGVFARNFLSRWLKDETRNVVVYAAAAVDAATLFHIPGSPNIVIRRVNTRNFVTRIIFEQLIFPWRLRGARLYFSPTPSIPFLGRLLNRGTRFIVTIHDMIPFFVPTKYGTVRGIYVKMLSKYGARLASHVITVSQNSKADIETIAGVRSAKVSVVYNFLSQPVTVSKTDEKFFLCISTIEPGKNVENLLAGFSAFTKNHPGNPYRLVWIGKLGWGYTRAELDRLLDTYDLKGTVSFTGFVSDTEKGQLLSKCTAVVYLSKYEGFGLPVLEGMHYGKAAIVSSTSSLPEVMGSAGAYCNPEDPSSIAKAFSGFLTEKEQYEAAVPEQLKRFQPDEQIGQFINIINRFYSE